MHPHKKLTMELFPTKQVKGQEKSIFWEESRATQPGNVGGTTKADNHHNSEVMNIQ